MANRRFLLLHRNFIPTPKNQRKRQKPRKERKRKRKGKQEIEIEIEIEIPRCCTHKIQPALHTRLLFVEDGQGFTWHYIANSFSAGWLAGWLPACLGLSTLLICMHSTFLAWLGLKRTQSCGRLVAKMRNETKRNEMEMGLFAEVRRAAGKDFGFSSLFLRLGVGLLCRVALLFFFLPNGLDGVLFCASWIS